MKICVTGGAGFIGSNFIHYWLKEHPEDSIINLDLLTYAGNLENLTAAVDNSHYTFMKGDICNADDVSRAFEGVETVVHFAAESHVDRSIKDPSAFIQTNVIGTYTLLEAAVKHGIKRFHHVSTDEVFGALPLDTQEKFDEHTAYDPRSPYSASKASSDHLVRAYYHTFGLPISISNCANNYGPYHHPEKLIPLAITNLIEGKKVPVYGDGKYVRDWLHVEDHARAIDAIIHKGKVGETYCIGAMVDDVSNLELIHKILEIMGATEESIEYVKDRPGHDRRYAINWNKIHTELGWSPQIDLDEGLKMTVDWYKEHKDWWQRVKSGEYKEYYDLHYGA